jgi:hypothetical protein
MKKNPLFLVGGVAVALVFGLAILRNSSTPKATSEGTQAINNNGPKELLKVGFLPVT